MPRLKVFIITVVIFIISFFNPDTTPVNPVIDIPLKISEKAILELNSGSQEDILIDHMFVSFNLDNDSDSAAVVNFMFYLTFITIAFFILFFLWKIFRSIRNSLRYENVFDYKNVWRIRFIAFILVFSTIIEIVYPVFLKYFWFNQIIIEENALDIGLNFDAAIDIIWALIILVIAEVYRIGLEIKKEQELTI